MGPFAGRTVLVTGNVDGLTREQVKDAIVDLGGTAASGVTGKVDLVILGDGAGLSKTAKARALRIPVMSGESFGELVANPHGWDGQRLGVTFEDWDASVDPDPEPPAPKVDRNHWVAKAVGYVRNTEGKVVREVRLQCACGHLWMRTALWGDDSCPRPEVPVTVAPWKVVA